MTFQSQSNEELLRANARLIARRTAANPPPAPLRKVVVPLSEFERDLLDQWREVIGIEGMKKIGGCLLTYVRGNEQHPPKPGKVLRVLAEVQRKQKEGFRPDTTWHWYALHLLKLFSD